MAGFGFPTTVNSIPGDAKHFDGQDVSNPGNTITLISETVPAGKVYSLVQLLASCRMSGVFKVYAGTSLIGSGRTAPGSANIYFSWLPIRPIGESVVVRVDFQALSGSPSADVEAYLMAAET
jgi:hypothetical protein